jgi:RNA-binding protein YhbY
MEIEKLKSLKVQAKSMKATFAVGKSGITDSVIQQIVLYIKANKLCKIKYSRAFLDSQQKTKKELSQEIAEKTNTDLIDQVGNIAVFWKR